MTDRCVQDTGQKMGCRLRLKVFLRSLALQASWNPQRMQNLGLLSCLLPLRSSRPGQDINADRIFCRRYYEFFNTNPYLANFIIGGLIRLEQEMDDGQGLDPHLPLTYRDSLGRTFASLGDQLFWLGLRPALIMVLCFLGLLEHTGGILLGVGIFAVLQLGLRWWSLHKGYLLGMEILGLLRHPFWHTAIKWTRRTAMLATGLVGGLFLTRVQDMSLPAGKSLLWAGVALGVGLPLIMRRRLPGEGLLVVAVGLSFLLTFAIWPPGH